MKPINARLRKVLAILATSGVLALAYWAGYRAGLKDRGPDYRGLMVVRRTPGNSQSSGTSSTWFDVRNPLEAARLQKEEARLKAAGAEYYIARGVITSTLNAEPDLRKVNSHR